MEKIFNGCNLNILSITDHKIVHKEKMIIMNYSPIEGSEDAEEYFENLTNVVNSIPNVIW